MLAISNYTCVDNRFLCILWSTRTSTMALALDDNETICNERTFFNKKSNFVVHARPSLSGLSQSFAHVYWEDLFRMDFLWLHHQGCRGYISSIWSLNHLILLVSLLLLQSSDVYRMLESWNKARVATAAYEAECAGDDSRQESILAIRRVGEIGLLDDMDALVKQVRVALDAIGHWRILGFIGVSLTFFDK